MSRQPLPVIGQDVEWLTMLDGLDCRDIEYFGGPLLFVASFDGAHCIFKWASCDDHAHRWIVAQTTLERVASYERGEISMLNLLREGASDGGNVLLVDVGGPRVRAATGISRLLATRQVAFDKLPEKYLPLPSAMHDLELQ